MIVTLPNSYDLFISLTLDDVGQGAVPETIKSFDSLDELLAVVSDFAKGRGSSDQNGPPRNDDSLRVDLVYGDGEKSRSHRGLGARIGTPASRRRPQLFLERTIKSTSGSSATAIGGLNPSDPVKQADTAPPDGILGFYCVTDYEDECFRTGPPKPVGSELSAHKYAGYELTDDIWDNGLFDRPVTGYYFATNRSLVWRRHTTSLFAANSKAVAAVEDGYAFLCECVGLVWDRDRVKFHLIAPRAGHGCMAVSNPMLPSLVRVAQGWATWLGDVPSLLA
ncbi:hypothetical protein DHEL01_v210880 [Diaporthe helianthi]|uniref:Uncharacterized protein n=1 Tax=Diaporthe helianthi TaxID=158607 RepID=A0A2P5HKH2_DIAHE|nr:hypothetical protein DHEL01_v210880 [Diaporthe helianthi]